MDEGLIYGINHTEHGCLTLPDGLCKQDCINLDFEGHHARNCAAKIGIMASRLLILVFALALAQSSIAESGVSFEWVTVGDPGNPNDPLTGVTSQTPPVRGAVPYLYSISKYETTIGQYTAFLNAVAKSDPERAFSLYNEDLGHYDTIRGIARISVDGTDVYYVKNGPRGGGTSAYLPITYISYLDAVRFANWLHNDQGDGRY